MLFVHQIEEFFRSSSLDRLIPHGLALLIRDAASLCKSQMMVFSGRAIQSIQGREVFKPTSKEKETPANEG